jgi:hypothetical protein
MKDLETAAREFWETNEPEGFTEFETKTLTDIMAAFARSLNQWTRMEDGLPESIGEYNTTVINLASKPFVKKLYFCGDWYESKEDYRNDKLYPLRVIAWQLLLAPYQGENDDQ